jgi:hypothetical protein
VSELEPEITPNKFELAAMQRVCIGNWALYVYIAFMVLTYWGILWGYGAIFASSMIATIPVTGEVCNIYAGQAFGNACWGGYWIFMVIYSVVVILLVLLGLKEQKTFQACMSFMRFGIIAILVVSALAMAEENVPTIANPAGLMQTLPILIFANGIHPSIPTYT